MKINKLYCPSCGAPLEFKDGRTKVYCEYCGSPISLDDESFNMSITNRIVDEARIKEVDLENRLLDIAREEDAVYKRKEEEWKHYLLYWLLSMGGALFLRSVFTHSSFMLSLADNLLRIILLVGGVIVLAMKPKKPRALKDRANDGELSKYSDKNVFIVFALSRMQMARTHS